MKIDRIALLAAAPLAAVALIVLPGSALASPTYTIDFETDDQGNVLVASDAPGTDPIDDEFADFGVLLSTVNGPGNPLQLFDSEGADLFGDQDLGTGPAFGTPGQGNVLIIESDPGNNVPNDFAGGGAIIFDFDPMAELAEIGLLDDVAGTFVVDYLGGGQQVLPFSQSGENTLMFYDFTAGPFALTQNGSVTRLTVNLGGSGAVTGLTFTAVPEPGTLALAGFGGLALVGLGLGRRRAR